MKKVLIACEYSGTVRDAFLRRGHDAISCDLLPTDVPGPHHQGDVIELLERPSHWDLIIAHPECTKLCVSGNRWYGEGMPKYHERLKSAVWTEMFWELCKSRAPRVCFENPVGVLPRLTGMGKPSYVQPWQFGHGETKKTGLWLHKLPPLVPTNVVEGREARVHKLPPSADRWKLRSTTYQGIAGAMASQWGCL